MIAPETSPWQAYLVGWLVAAPIGPVNMEIIRRSLQHGALRGWMVGLGAACVDAAYLLIFTAGFGLLLRDSRNLSVTLHFLGGSLLIYLGVDAIRSAWIHLTHPPELAAPSESPGVPSLLRLYLLGLAMTALNPMTLAFWSSLSLQFARDRLQTRIVSSAMVWLGALSWTIALALALAFARRWVGPRLFAVVTAMGGACLLYFGGSFILRAFR